MRGWRLAVALPLLSGVHAGAFTASEATAQSFDDLHYVDLRDVLAFGSRRPQRSMVCRYISRTINA